MKTRQDNDWKLLSFKKFISRNQSVWWITGIFLLLTYGIKIFNVSISHDTEAIMSVSDGLYESWYAMGRFGLIFLKKLLGTYVLNPYAASFLMVVAMMAASIVWMYLFCWLGNKPEQYYANNWIFPVIFFTSLIMAEQCGFLLQAYEVNVTFFLVGISLLNLYDAILEKRKWYWYIPAVFCCVIAFATYQSFVLLFAAGASVCFLLVYDRCAKEGKPFTIKYGISLIGKLIAVFFISFLFYVAVNWMILSLTGIEAAAYITDQILWGVLPVKECILNICRHIFQVLKGEGIFYSIWITPLYAIVILLALFRIRKREKGYFLYLVATAFSLCSPFFLLVLMGNAPTKRTEILIPFMMGFFAWYLTDLVAMRKQREKNKKKWKAAYTTLLVALAFLTMRQSLMSAKLYYTQYIQYEEDISLAVKITDRIERLGFGESPEIPVLFVGRRIPAEKPSCYRAEELELIGHSFFEVIFGPRHGSYVISNFLKTIGYTYQIPETAEAQRIAGEVGDMPVWPDEGCVAVKDGVIIVNLGEPELKKE